MSMSQRKTPCPKLAKGSCEWFICMIAHGACDDKLPKIRRRHGKNQNGSQKQIGKLIWFCRENLNKISLDRLISYQFTKLDMQAVSFSHSVLPYTPSRVPQRRYSRCVPHARFSLEKGGQYGEELQQTAKYISRRGFGILASDESNVTTGKRLQSIGKLMNAFWEQSDLHMQVEI